MKTLRFATAFSLLASLGFSVYANAATSFEVLNQSYESYNEYQFLRLTVRSNSPGKLVIKNQNEVSGTGICSLSEDKTYICMATAPAIGGLHSGLTGLVLTKFYVESANGERSEVKTLADLL